LSKLASLESVHWLNDADEAPMSATALVGNLELLVPMAGLIDKEAELARLNKEISKLEQDITRTEAKLANPGFVDKAPAEVVDKERVRLGETKTSADKLREQIQKISKL